VVSPRRDRQTRTIEETRARTIRALVRPGEPIRTEADETQTVMSMQRHRMESLEQAQNYAEQEFIRRTLASTTDQLEGLQPQIDLSLPQPPIPKYNGQLGMNFDGQTLNFSMGSSPGELGAVHLPKGIDEGPVKLTPKPGGGFDLSIDVPQQ
jgi:hypothetical protein